MLNEQKTEYVWQPGKFAVSKNVYTTKTGRQSYYYPDLFLIDENKYIEIKGWLNRNPASKLKWEWFHETYPNSELWQYKELKEKGII